MEQRIYHGNIDPNGLADYLVNTFNQGRTVAQKVGQGDHLLVQIGRPHSGGYIRHALGISIAKTPDGVSVASGQSNWFDLANPSLAGFLIGAIFWPPLLIFPLARGIRGYAQYQNIWESVEVYCTQAGGRQGQTTTAHAVYCQTCGSANDEGVQFCTMCGAALHAPQPSASQEQSAQPVPVGGGGTEQVTCQKCGQTVAGTKFCGNCGSSLS